jgi:tetratricopeptide (TPR) repeat protein
VATSPAPKSAAAAEKAAAQLYKNKSFGDAVAMLRAAAGRDSANAERLTGLAEDYATVGAGISKGEAAEAGAPGAAMSAYQDALKADTRSGQAVHSAFLRGRIAKVAPPAALAFLQQDRYEQARGACDAAVNYGVGSDPTVMKVRRLLEEKAKDFFNRGLALEKANLAEAKTLYRRVLKMVPADSVWYVKSYAAVNKPSRNQSTDEDE